MHHKTYDKKDDGDSGHYFVHQLYKGSWYKCDDEKVTKIQDDKKSEIFLKHGGTLSALFYLRRESNNTSHKEHHI